jgi:hypothetical protein
VKRPKDKKAASAKLQANVQARNRTKLQLIKAARDAEKKPWPQYLWPDGTQDAWFHRKSIDARFIETSGGFSSEVVTLAITDPAWETKEGVANWLRNELKKLRHAEATPGMTPVRRGETLSRIQISEIAIELLECIGGEELVCLFQELLEIDRHRKSLAENYLQPDRAAEVEAMALLQGHSLGVRALAKHMRVAPSTVTRWKKSRSFFEKVESYKRSWEDVLRGDYFEQIKIAFPQATEGECFRQAFKLYLKSLPERRARRVPRKKA